MSQQNKTITKPRGRGKPAFFGVPMKRHNVMLDAQTVAKLKRLGWGNLSAGIREAVIMLYGKS